MDDYISRAAAIDALQSYSFPNAPKVESGIKIAINLIETLPAADVVPRVKCKDCTEYYVTRHWCVFHSTTFEPDASCSYGERKEQA